MNHRPTEHLDRGGRPVAINQADDMVTVAEAAKALRVSVATIKRWLKDGRLPAFHLGPRYIRIRRADLNRVLIPVQRGEVTPMSERDFSPLETDLSVKPFTDDEVNVAL